MPSQEDYDTLLAERNRLLAVNKEMRFKMQALIEKGSVIVDSFFHNNGEVTEDQIDDWYSTLIWPPAYSWEEAKELRDMEASFKRKPKKHKSNG